MQQENWQKMAFVTKNGQKLEKKWLKSIFVLVCDKKVTRKLMKNWLEENWRKPDF